MNERTAANISDRQIISALNQGAYVFARDLGVYFEDYYPFYTIAAQQLYSLPSNFITSSNLLFSPWITHQPLSQVDINDLLNPFPLEGNFPSCYAIDIANKQIMLAPIPQVTAQSTTLNGGINATVTTITVASTSSMGAQGRVQIDSEIIYYTGINATTLQLTGCVRGVAGTSAAAHLTGATVQWLDMLMQIQRGPYVMSRSYVTGTIAITNGTNTVTGAGTNWLNGQNVYSGDWLGVGSYELTNAASTFPLTWYKIASVNSVTGITLVNNYMEPTVAAGSLYIISDSTDLMPAESEGPILFAEMEIYHSMGNDTKQSSAANNYAAELQQAKKRQMSPDYLPTVRKTKEAWNVNYPLPRMPGNYPENGGGIL
jgi:hypothetical protein